MGPLSPSRVAPPPSASPTAVDVSHRQIRHAASRSAAPPSRQPRRCGRTSSPLQLSGKKAHWRRRRRSVGGRGRRRAGGGAALDLPLDPVEAQPPEGERGVAVTSPCRRRSRARCWIRRRRWTRHCATQLHLYTAGSSGGAAARGRRGRGRRWREKGCRHRWRRGDAPPSEEGERGPSAPFGMSERERED